VVTRRPSPIDTPTSGVIIGPQEGSHAFHHEANRPTVNDPVGPPPDPSHIPTVLPKDIKWTGQEGRQQMGLLFGDPNKAGLYGVVYKWYPGNFSQPHFHDQERYA